MFLDSELHEIAEAKARLGTRCELRRQVVRLEAQTAWASLRRRISYATLGMNLGLHLSGYLLGYLRRRKSQGA